MVKQNQFFYLLFGVLFLLAYAPNIFLLLYGGVNLRSFIYFILGILLCLFPAMFLKSKVYFAIYFIFVLVAPIEIGHIYINKVPLTSGFIQTIFNTNKSEVVSYLSSMKFLALLTVFYWVIYCFLWIKIPNEYLLNKKLRKIGIGFYVFLFLTITVSAVVSHVRHVPSTSRTTVFETVITSFKTKLYNIYPYNAVSKMSAAISDRKALTVRYKNIESFTFDATPKKGTEKEVYIFVLGESARYANFGINGYHRNTSPRLDSMKKHEQLLTFTDVHASSNLTNIVVPLMMTRSTVLDMDITNTEKSIISLCKETGFKTYVLSNQGENELFLRQLAKEADYSYVANNDFSFDKKYDGQLLQHVDSIVNTNENKICLFLFTQGSHVKYNFRYPKEFEVYKPAIDKSYFTHEATYENRELFINAYDNSILYTDFVLGSIIGYLNDLHCKASLFYISDHGENIFDTPDVSIGHGFVVPTENELHIPMFIWFSENYKNANQNLYTNLRNNIDKKINTTNVFYTFANIVGAQYNLYEKEKDASSHSFIPDSVHWFMNPNREAVQINNFDEK